VGQLLAVLIPGVVVAIVVVFDVICLLDLKKAHRVYELEKPQWAAAILLFGPFGCMAYWMLGRER
jgi:hypothetical protein